MSRRSYASDYDTHGHERRMSKHRVTDEDLFNYVLRVAYLSYIMLPKSTARPSAPDQNDWREKEQSSRLASLSSFSIGDLFKDIRDGPKSVKFPEKMLRYLETKLQNIAMGKDPGYTDQLLRRTMAKFYTQFMDDSFKRQMKENRKIEELILMFATHATAVLKKEPSMAGDRWKNELNNHIAQFVKVLRECLRNVSSHVSPELTSRLDMYTAKLAPQIQAAQAYSDSGYDSSSNRDSVGSSAPPLSNHVSDMAIVQTVGALFKLADGTLQREVDQLREVVSERAAVVDLKTCLKNINAGVAFPGRREDFDTEEAWQQWHQAETSNLSQMIVAMVQLNPALAKSAPAEVLPRPGSLYEPSHGHRPSASRSGSISSRRSYYENGNGSSLANELDQDDDISVGHNFTFIPPNPKKYYRKLLEYCLVTDLEMMMSEEVDDSDEVSLGILTAQHIELINECALRWRIGQPYRVTCFLDLVKSFYERQEVPFECIPEALQNVQKVSSDIELHTWPLADSDYLSTIYSGVFNIFLSALYHAMEAIPTVKSSEVDPFLFILEHVRDSGLLDRFNVDISARLRDVEKRAQAMAGHWYDLKLKELSSQPGVNRALPMLFMTDELEKHAKGLDKRFPEPLLGQIDLVSLAVGVWVPKFVAGLQEQQKRLFEASMNGPTPDIPIQDIFALYRRLGFLLDMHGAYCERTPIKFDISSFFAPYVRQWLVNTDNKTGQWVDAAVQADKFEAEGPEGHSSSIVDLFESLKSPINFLDELEWANDYENARFYTGLSKTVAKAVEQYCRSIETLFLTEMFPRPTDYVQPQKPSAWLEKAKQLAALTGEKRVDPFNFLPESCVKLNNVEAARRLLDQMSKQMKAEQMEEILMANGPPVPEKGEGREKFLFTVKIVLAEGLVPLDASPSSKLDSFVTLSDKDGNRLAKTRTIYETLGPRWDETFDISVDDPLWLMVSVRDRALVGKHDTVGKAYLCLDPRRFGDFLTHDLWMDLNTQGRVLVRISMEGEKDDIQFYFGRAFRSLKRAESDMLRIFIDKMSPFIRQCMSRAVVKTLLKPGQTGGVSSSLDYNKAVSGITGLYQSAFGKDTGEPMIPLPASEKPRVKPEELTDVEIEQAIVPLFDYFDSNLQTLNTYLSDQAKEMVMTRVWKEILMTIEGLLIPLLADMESNMKPLSDKEVDIVFKWLKFLRDYFYAGGEGPVPIEMIQNQKYRDVLSIRLYYDWHTDALMEECVRVMQDNLRQSVGTVKKAKSVYQSKNLGTIKNRKKEKKQDNAKNNNGEIIMRILRMRPNTSEFIADQLTMMQLQAAQEEQRAREIEERKQRRAANRGNEFHNRGNEMHARNNIDLEQIPEVPPLPGKN
ncbi:hypothetical protein DL96DRAFT_806757 [Flagelloscypha sp. PMI_526]|nr:hypothetical protein DL96DRAFT_806757 [Flagelloscypha sp. PMI_526]